MHIQTFHNFLLNYTIMKTKQQSNYFISLQNYRVQSRYCKISDEIFELMFFSIVSNKDYFYLLLLLLVINIFSKICSFYYIKLN